MSDAAAILTSQLRDGEQIVWIDRPIPLAYAKSKIGKGLFGIPFFAFSVFWLIKAAQSGEPLMALFGVPFVAVGAWLILSPIWAYRSAQKWLIYAITNQRLIIFRMFPSHLINSFAPSDIQATERTTKADGLGTVTFAKETHHVLERHGTFRRHRSRTRTRTRHIGFFCIKDVQRVEQAILDLKTSVE